jgi:hypothetical protein
MPRPLFTPEKVPRSLRIGGCVGLWTKRLEEKSFASAGDWTLVIQTVARHCIDWATPAPDLFAVRIDFLNII